LAQPIKTNKVHYKGLAHEKKKRTKSSPKKQGMSLPPIKDRVDSYSSLIQVKPKEPQTSKNAAMYSIKPKQPKILTKIETMEINRKSTAGSVATPNKRKKNPSGMSKYQSPKDNMARQS
jgi:hypothetical protein